MENLILLDITNGPDLLSFMDDESCMSCFRCNKLMYHDNKDYLLKTNVPYHPSSIKRYRVTTLFLYLHDLISVDDPWRKWFTVHTLYIRDDGDKNPFTVVTNLYDLDHITTIVMEKSQQTFTQSFYPKNLKELFLTITFPSTDQYHPELNINELIPKTVETLHLDWSNSTATIRMSAPTPPLNMIVRYNDLPVHFEWTDANYSYIDKVFQLSSSRISKEWIRNFHMYCYRKWSFNTLASFMIHKKKELIEFIQFVDKNNHLFQNDEIVAILCLWGDLFANTNPHPDMVLQICTALSNIIKNFPTILYQIDDVIRQLFKIPVLSPIMFLEPLYRSGLLVNYYSTYEYTPYFVIKPHIYNSLKQEFTILCQTHCKSLSSENIAIIYYLLSSCSNFQDPIISLIDSTLLKKRGYFCVPFLFPISLQCRCVLHRTRTIPRETDDTIINDD